MQSVRTQDTVPLLKAAKRVVLLTGTPALSRPKELFSQLTALAPSAKLKMKDYGERYCQCDRYRPYAGQYDGESSTLLSSVVHGANACPSAQLLRIPCYAVKLQSYQACGGTPRYPAAMLHMTFCQPMLITWRRVSTYSLQ